MRDPSGKLNKDKDGKDDDEKKLEIGKDIDLPKDGNGILLDKHGNALKDKDGKPMKNPEGAYIDSNGDIKDKDGDLLANEDGTIKRSPTGELRDNDGNPRDENGNLRDPEGSIAKNIAGDYKDPEGQWRDKEGNILPTDEAGNWRDSKGNLRDLTGKLPTEDDGKLFIGKDIHLPKDNNGHLKDKHGNSLRDKKGKEKSTPDGAYFDKDGNIRDVDGHLIASNDGEVARDNKGNL